MPFFKQFVDVLWSVFCIILTIECISYRKEEMFMNIEPKAYDKYIKFISSYQSLYNAIFTMLFLCHLNYCNSTFGHDKLWTPFMPFSYLPTDLAGKSM